jgi:NTE family protein
LNLRPIESLVIAPSERLDGIAAQYVGALPRPVRALLEVLGANRGNGAALASYLLFESAYTRVLIDLGCRDTLARSEQVLTFLTDRRGPAPSHAPRVVVV